MVQFNDVKFLPTFNIILYYIFMSFFLYVLEDCLDAAGNPISGEPFENPDDCNKFFQVKLVVPTPFLFLCEVSLYSMSLSNILYFLLCRICNFFFFIDLV